MLFASIGPLILTVKWKLTVIQYSLLSFKHSIKLSTFGISPFHFLWECLHNFKPIPNIWKCKTKLLSCSWNVCVHCTLYITCSSLCCFKTLEFNCFNKIWNENGYDSHQVKTKLRSHLRFMHFFLSLFIFHTLLHILQETFGFVKKKT